MIYALGFAACAGPGDADLRDATMPSPTSRSGVAAAPTTATSWR